MKASFTVLFLMRTHPEICLLETIKGMLLGYGDKLEAEMSTNEASFSKTNGFFICGGVKFYPNQPNQTNSTTEM
jgi:hypothetical protein